MTTMMISTTFPHHSSRQSYPFCVKHPVSPLHKQERDCLVHFARLAKALLKDGDNHVLASNFAKYLPILNYFHAQTEQQIFLNLVINNTTTP